MEKSIEMNMKFFKARYISDIKSIFFKKGEVYEAHIPLDDPTGRFFSFYLEDYDEPGYYALPSGRFEVVEDPE